MNSKWQATVASSAIVGSLLMLWVLKEGTAVLSVIEAVDSHPGGLEAAILRYPAATWAAWSLCLAVGALVAIRVRRERQGMAVAAYAIATGGVLAAVYYLVALRPVMQGF